MALTKRNIIARLEVLIPEAIAFLQKHEPKRGYFLAFSGGKDSIVTRKLCDLAGVKYVAGYSRTGIDPPEVMHFMKKNYPNTKWLKPKNDFYSLIRKKMPPLMHTRWCCDYLKERAGIEFKRQFSISITGVRAEESGKRALRPRIDILENVKIVNIKPIFHWLEYHIWAFIEKHNLEYPSLYDEGFERIGCVVCPALFYSNQTKVNQHRDRWPKIYMAFKNAVRDWYESKEIKDNRHTCFEDYYKAYLHGFEKPKKLVSMREKQQEIKFNN